MPQPLTQLLTETLQLPPQLPLFNYNVNFNNLKQLITQIQAQANTNQQQIHAQQQLIGGRLEISSYQDNLKFSNNKFNFGCHAEKVLNHQLKQSLSQEMSRKELKSMNPLEHFCYKMQQMTSLLDHLVVKVNDHEERISSDDKKNQKALDMAIKRLQDKMNHSLEGFDINVQNFFKDNSTSLSNLEAQHGQLRNQVMGKFSDLQNDLNNKLGESSFKAQCQSLTLKIKAEMKADLLADEGKRQATYNTYQTKLQELGKDVEIRQKAMNEKVAELTAKLGKTLQTSSFETQKHKIYDRLSEFKQRMDQLQRKSGQFIDFRKNSMLTNQKFKQEVIGLEDEVKKLQAQGGSFKKLQNIGQAIQSLDPHMICELSSQVKLHQKQLGKLQKQLLSFQTSLAQKKGSAGVSINNGQNASQIQKIIKEYMGNLDFEGRLKNAEHKVTEVSRRNDAIHQLEKKLNLFIKENDLTALTKEVNRKSNDESTRKQLRILQTKIQTVWGFIRQMRKDNERPKSSKMETTENYSLTTKRLYPPNCLSCLPQGREKTQMGGGYGSNNGRRKLDLSMDESKFTVYSKKK